MRAATAGKGRLFILDLVVLKRRREKEEKFRRAKENKFVCRAAESGIAARRVNFSGVFSAEYSRAWNASGHKAGNPLTVISCSPRIIA